MQEASCPSVLLDFCSVRLSNFTSVPLAQDTFKHFLNKTKKLMLIARQKPMSEIFSRVHATLQPALSVGWSVGRSHFTFFYDLVSLTSLLLPKWSGDLKYGPCPPTRLG